MCKEKLAILVHWDTQRELLKAFCFARKEAIEEINTNSSPPLWRCFDPARLLFELFSEPPYTARFFSQKYCLEQIEFHLQKNYFSKGLCRKMNHDRVNSFSAPWLYIPST